MPKLRLSRFAPLALVAVAALPARAQDYAAIDR